MSHFRVIRNAALCALTVFVVGGCTSYGGAVYEPAPHHGRPFQVPPGHMPPPGACRIWFPDRPPGHQPPPGNCYELERRVPPGAVLIRG